MLRGLIRALSSCQFLHARGVMQDRASKKDCAQLKVSTPACVRMRTLTKLIMMPDASMHAMCIYMFEGEDIN